MKLTATHIIFIVQSAFILILFLVVVFRKPPSPTVVDYNKIKSQIEESTKVRVSFPERRKESINTLKSEFDSLSGENTLLYKKMDSLKYQMPDNKKSLDKINREIKRLNETYIISNYRDSSDAALIRRLSGE